jgi:hypothetical protein
MLWERFFLRSHQPQIIAPRNKALTTAVAFSESKPTLAPPVNLRKQFVIAYESTYLSRIISRYRHRYCCCPGANSKPFALL